jgi:HAD superfamily hydrolase (TIGR01509 family)
MVGPAANRAAVGGDHRVSPPRARGRARLVPPLAILDIDGTLVDTNHHHAIAWYRAFRQQGIVLPLRRIHSRMGMGGDKLVADLAGEQVEREHGDAVRAAEKPLYLALAEEVEAMPGARELVEELKRRDHRVVLASSAKPYEVERYLDLLDLREIVDGWTTAGEVEETKPAPDLVRAALEKGGGEDGGVLVGDSVWDCKAASGAGIESIGVLTGGFCREELLEAGASAVYESLEDLGARLDETALGRR